MPKVLDDTPAVEAYLATFPREIRGRLEQVRATIRAAAPGAIELMRYGIPTFHLEKNLVHFGGFTKHIGFYPGPGAIVTFADELTGFVTSKGAIQLPHTDPLPLDLIRRITQARVKENLAGEKAHPKKRSERSR